MNQVLLALRSFVAIALLVLLVARVVSGQTEKPSFILTIGDRDVRILAAPDTIAFASAVIEQSDQYSEADVALAYERRGDAKLKEGDLESAIADYERASALNLDDSERRIKSLAACSRRTLIEMPSNAALVTTLVEQTNEVLRRDPECASAWALLAGLQLDLDQKENARDSIEHALRLRVNLTRPPYVHSKAAAIFNTFREWRKVYDLAEASISLDQCHLPHLEYHPYVARANGMVQLGDAAGARCNYELSWYIAPDSYNSLLGLWRAYKALGFRGASALAGGRCAARFPDEPATPIIQRDLDDATSVDFILQGMEELARDPESVVLHDVARVPFLTGPEILRLVDQAAARIDELPPDIRTRTKREAEFLRSQVHLNSGDHDSAFRALRALVAQDANERRFRFELARALLGSRRLAESHRLLDALRKDEPEDIELLLLDAEVSFAEQNYLQVRARCNRVLVDDGRHARAFYLRGLAKWKQGESVEAYRDLNRAILNDPVVSAPHVERAHIDFARALSTIDELDSAIPNLCLARQINPNDFEVEYAIWQLYHDAGQVDMALYLAERLHANFRDESRAREALESSKLASSANKQTE